jgi:hypothetical protein
MNELWQSNYTFQEECKKSIDIKTTYILSLEAHIAELEALQAPKSCDGCKFGKFGVDSVGLEVECELNWNCSIAHVNRYEPKDSK